MFPWNSGRIIGLFVCSGVLFILVGIQQTYTIFTIVARRILPVEFFKMPTILTLLLQQPQAELPSLFRYIWRLSSFSLRERNLLFNPVFGYCLSSSS